jgi:delta 1-pyrroline-5-carboxylate dehydrogenase
MSTITELNTTTASTFAEGRALDECVGGVDKNAIAETKQEKKLAAAAKKAAKEVEKQRKAAEKAAKDAEKQRKAEVKAAEKQRKMEEKAAKAAAVAAKKAERELINAQKETEKQRKMEEKAAKAEAAAAKKAEREAKKAKREAKKVSPSSAQADETLHEQITDEAAETVSEIAIAPQNPPALVVENAADARDDSIPAQVSEAHSEVVAEEEMVVPAADTEEEVGEENAGEEEAGEENADVVESFELSEEEWDVQIHGEETDAQKIVRLRKEANDLIRRARELELSLPQPVTLEHSENSDMREIDGIMYRVEETFLYNRYDELVGFIEKDDEVTFTTGWDSARGIWAYEATD